MEAELTFDLGLEHVSGERISQFARGKVYQSISSANSKAGILYPISRSHFIALDVNEHGQVIG